LPRVCELWVRRYDSGEQSARMRQVTGTFVEVCEHVPLPQVALRRPPKVASRAGRGQQIDRRVQLAPIGPVRSNDQASL
jgi:hypothetical protein